MTPKEAYEHIEHGLYDAGTNYISCSQCRAALSVLRALVEQPTVEDVREEIKKRQASWEDVPGHLASVRWGLLSDLLDFIDRKGVPDDR